MTKTKYETCLQQMADPPPETWVLKRRPKCNRMLEHEGDHREYDSGSFAVKAEWTDAQCWVPRDKHARA